MNIKYPKTEIMIVLGSKVYPLYTSFSVDDVHIIDIFVKEVYRNKGIGSSLLQELINISKNYNYSEITLEVNVHNLPAQKLYNKFHFEKVGIRKKYYNNTDDAILMAIQI